MAECNDFEAQTTKSQIYLFLEVERKTTKQKNLKVSKTIQCIHAARRKVQASIGAFIVGIPLLGSKP